MQANGQLVAAPKTTSQKFLIDYDQPSMDLIRATYAKDATPQEFQLLLYMSRTYGLDILTKKIWCVKYGRNPAQIFAGRDGFLEIAHSHSSRSFDGMNTTVEEVQKPFTVKVFKWEGYGDNAKKVYFDKTFDTQFKARTEVWRKDMTRPFVVEVWEEEYSTGMDNWDKKRRTMISKVSESQCLRKAFSISGLYAPEETGEGDLPPDIQNAVVVEEPGAGTAKPQSAPEVSKVQPGDVEEPEGERVKRMKSLRAHLNKTLQACKTEEEHRAAAREFAKMHGGAIWNTPTGHNATETFLTLATEHQKRVSGESLIKAWREALAKADDMGQIDTLAKTYLDNPILQTTENEEAMNKKARELGHPLYTETGDDHPGLNRDGEVA